MKLGLAFSAAHMAIGMFLLNPFLFAQSGLGDSASGPTTTTTVQSADDAMFGAGVADTVADPSQKLDIGTLSTTKQPVLRGSYETVILGSVGWTDYPDINDIWSGFSPWLGFSLDSLVNFDLRPDPAVRVGGTLRIELPSGASIPLTGTELPSDNPTPPPASISYTGVGIGFDEIFFDYTFAQSLFFRIGKYLTTWGQGRIFNPGNIINNGSLSNTGLSMKAFIPILSNGLTLIVLGQQQYFADSKNPSFKELGYGALFEQSVGPLVAGVSGFYQYNQGSHIDGYVRTSFHGFDLYAELTAALPENELPIWNGPTWNFLAGFFWEGLSPKIQVIGEYWYNQDTLNSGGRDHRIGLALSMDPIPGLGLQPKLLWYHAFMDGSGQIAIGFGFNIGPHLAVTIAPAYSYGNYGSTYVSTASNSDPDPAHRRMFLLVKLDLTGDF